MTITRLRPLLLVAAAHLALSGGAGCKDAESEDPDPDDSTAAAPAEAAGGDPVETRAQARAEDHLEATEIEVQGWHCSSCLGLTLSALREESGVSEAAGAFEDSIVVVAHDPEVVGAQDLVGAITELGYGAAIADPR